MNKISTLQKQLQEAHARQNFGSFTQAIEEVRQLALAGEQEAQRVFINWYRQLNPAFDRIIPDRFHPDILKLRFRQDLFKRVLH